MPRDQYPSKKSLGDHILNEVWDSQVYIGTIEAEHRRIHLGVHYFKDFYLADIDDPSGVKFFIHPTGYNNETHFLYAANFSAGTRVEIYEGFEPESTGVEYVMNNNNRSITASSSTLLYKDCVLSGVNAAAMRATGTLISVLYMGQAGANPNQNAPGAGGRNTELILSPNIKYLFWVRPDADNTKGSVGFNWYDGN